MELSVYVRCAASSISLKPTDGVVEGVVLGVVDLLLDVVFDVVVFDEHA